MTSGYKYDLAVIGSGPGGYVAAIRASQLKLKTVIIEKDKLGGVCLNIGCIPSKNIIHQASIFASVGTLRKMGVTVDTSTFDYKKVHQDSRTAATRLSKGVEFLLKKNNIEVISGEASIAGKNELLINKDQKITTKNILIASGSVPRQIPGFEFDEQVVLSSTGALMLQELPKRLLILGSGAIGCEFAYIMNAFGVEVHLVEMLDRVLPLEDEEIASVLENDFSKKGIKIYTGTKATGMSKKEDGITVHLEQGEKKLTVEADKILVAVGRAPFTDRLGLENVGLKTEKGFIPVGDYYQTKVPGIFAIGDVIASPQLAHVASKEGEIAVEFMAGHKPAEPAINPMTIPSAVYCEPQVGSFGYKERELKEKKIPYNKSVFPYRGVGKAVAIHRAEGLVKVLTHAETKEILGAHIVGAEATELIHEILLAKTAELVPEDIAAMIHAHPTLSEAVAEAFRMSEGWAVHI
ncbi:MAG: dihydrolipoyl dehydrogenase [Candidatus Auribacter fodinae]|jgi:dihydrolipoamide dehydrogenase|uniref:Dihydrolipoyl dehydrogenase n=1 Tax=Candidatus Auribacter fodinae TaxID=2093366 RepID=A0A3A4R5W8_9BACT|nr:MAG: dihydrolipoyl dehydrogenase [Candidatus Auribacter fodinae]